MGVCVCVVFIASYTIVMICDFVLGDVSMHVVCFIWDQCFLGLGIGEYQYIPYLITALLLIMREPLLLCKEVSSI